MSSTVTGRHTPEAALQLLLEGAGLVAEKVRTLTGDTFTLREVTTGQAEAPRAAMAALLGNARGFHGLVQARILQALCAQSSTVPGRYEALLRFRLDAEGRIQGAQLLDSTGDTRRDADILKALQQLRVDRPPQSLAERSLTMAILPRGQQCRPDEQTG